MKKKIKEIIEEINNINIMDIDGEEDDLSVQFILDGETCSIYAEVYDEDKVAVGDLYDIFEHYNIKYKSFDRYAPQSGVGRMLKAINNFFSEGIKDAIR